MTASAFIVHWNSPATCNSLCRSLLAEPWIREVIVIDNHSNPEQFRELVHVPGRVKTLRLEENFGWGRALNVALRPWLEDGKDEFCVISAHDADPSVGALEMLWSSMVRYPSMGGICPEYGRDELPRYYRFLATRMAPAMRQTAGSVETVGICNATLVAMRRTCLASIGLFDERMFAYGDEVELSLRAGRAGWKLGLCWGAIVRNPQTTTATNLRTYLFTRNTLMISRDYCGFVSTGFRAAWMPLKGILEMILRGAYPPGRGRARVNGWWDWVRRRHGRPPAWLFG
jgi:N-acetylglucosaminyl-diphospho-decaprenol L-rhamnosyltransferase